MPPDSDAWLSLSVSRVVTHIASRLLNLLAIFVGPAREWIPELIERAKALKVSGGFEEGTDLCVPPTPLS